MGASEIISQAAGRDVGQFLQSEELSTKQASTMAQVEMFGKELELKADQFNSEQERRGATDLMQGLLSLLGMQKQEEIARLSASSGGGSQKFDLTDLITLNMHENQSRVNLDNAVAESGLGNDPVLGSLLGRFDEALNIEFNIKKAAGILGEIADMPIEETANGGVVLNNVFRHSPIRLEIGDWKIGSPGVSTRGIDSKEYDNMWIRASGTTNEGQRYINNAVVEGGDDEAYGMGFVLMPGTPHRKHVDGMYRLTKSLLKQIEYDANEKLSVDPKDKRALGTHKLLSTLKSGIGISKLSLEFSKAYLNPSATKEDDMVFGLEALLDSYGVTLKSKTVRPKDSQKVISKLTQAIKDKTLTLGVTGQAIQSNPAIGEVYKEYFKGLVEEDSRRLFTKAQQYEVAMNLYAAAPDPEEVEYINISHKITDEGFDIFFDNYWGEKPKMQNEDGSESERWEAKKNLVVDYLVRAKGEKESDNYDKAKEWATKAMRMVNTIGSPVLNSKFTNFIRSSNGIDLDISVPEGVSIDLGSVQGRGEVPPGF